MSVFFKYNANRYIYIYIKEKLYLSNPTCQITESIPTVPPHRYDPSASL